VRGKGLGTFQIWFLAQSQRAWRVGWGVREEDKEGDEIVVVVHRVLWDEVWGDGSAGWAVAATARRAVRRWYFILKGVFFLRRGRKWRVLEMG
jgi:hypothetical protein